MAYSDGEYFAIVLDAAAQAQDAGDYGLAAALVIRDRNTELISAADRVNLRLSGSPSSLLPGRH